MNNDQLQQLLAAVTDGLQHPAGAYALTPGQVDPTNPLDYSTSSGIKIWNEASAPLPFKFNVEGKEVNTFCEALSERANKSGWNLTEADVIMINDSSTPAIQRNIITEYGRLTVAEITAAVQGWITEESRRAQNNMQMFTCIMASLTKEGRIKILAEQDKYHVGEGTNRRACAALLFKLLMQKAIIDTRATASLLRENLSSLDTYMSTVKSNIEQFNKYVKVNWEGLKARGESCDDLMINLFKGYQSASDREFVRYIKQKRDAYDDGGDIQPEALMTLALNKYETLLKQDMWNAKSQEQEQIVALTAELGKIKDANLQLARSLSKKQSKPSDKSKPDKKKDGKGKDKSNKKKSKRTHTGKWSWKNNAPAQGDPQTKEFEGTTYIWCPTHKEWGTHTHQQCRERIRLEAETAESGNTGPDNANQANNATYANALTALMSDMQDEE